MFNLLRNFQERNIPFQKIPFQEDFLRLPKISCRIYKSPNLSPLDYWFWRMFKSCMYHIN